MRVWLIFLAVFTCWAQKSASQFMVKYPISCENPSECPPWVVGISSPKGEDQFSVCSGSLITPDIIATNLHCLPADLQFSEKKCEGQIFFQFAKSGNFPEQTVGCDKVLSIAPPLEGEFIRLDYAFLKLNRPVSRPPVKYSQAGFLDLSLVTIFKVDPVKTTKNTTGIIRKIQCKAVQNSIMNPYFKNELSPLVMVSPCPIIKGNSGSGLIAPDGTIRGVISSDSEFLIDPALRARVKTQADLLQSASGTNFSCVPMPSVEFKPTALTENCKIQIDEKMRKDLIDGLLKVEIDKSLQEINVRVNQQMKAIRVGGSKLIFWRARKAEVEPAEKDDGILAKAQVRPFCLLPEMPDLSKYATKLKAQTATVSMPVTEFRLREKFDVYLRYQTVVEEHKFNMKVRLIPKDLLKQKGIEVLLTIEDDKTKSEEKLKLDLCQTIPTAKLGSPSAEQNQ